MRTWLCGRNVVRL